MGVCRSRVNWSAILNSMLIVRSALVAYARRRTPYSFRRLWRKFTSVSCTLSNKIMLFGKTPACFKLFCGQLGLLSKYSGVA